eukprot:12432366-Alexandrium_andersonii.AAC.1
MARNKAHGEDGIFNEVYLHAPRRMSMLLVPLLLKSIVRLQEPLQWKGGSLVELYKGSGSHAQLKNLSLIHI